MNRKAVGPPKAFYSGPLRWETLPPALEAQARQIFYSCGQYVVPTFEQWEVGFCREELPERELKIWMEIDAAFRDYFGRRELTPDLATQVVYHLLALSLGMEDNAPLFQELKRLYLES